MRGAATESHMLVHAHGHRRLLSKFAGGLQAVAAFGNIICGTVNTSITLVFLVFLFFVELIVIVVFF